MKTILFVLSMTVLSATASFGQFQGPGSFDTKGCADLSASIEILPISIYPAQDYYAYSVIAEIKNIGNKTFSPGLSGYTAYIYEKTGWGWSWIKKEAVPTLTPGSDMFLNVVVQKPNGVPMPAYMVRVVASNSSLSGLDCNLSNNVMYIYP